MHYSQVGSNAEIQGCFRIRKTKCSNLPYLTELKEKIIVAEKAFVESQHQFMIKNRKLGIKGNIVNTM